jgi:hypothetical protein
MADLSSLSFVIRTADEPIIGHRSIRRFFVSNTVLKLVNSCVGDLVILGASASQQEEVGTPLLTQSTTQKMLNIIEIILSRNDMAVIDVSR